MVFQCDECGKQFGIRIGTSKLKATQKEDNPNEQANENGYGSIVVIENVFHYKQVIPLQLGDNVIGRYQKGNPINTPFETVDPSVALNHCTINVSTGTFVDNIEIKGRERRIIEDGTLFTIGATSIILRTA